MGVISPRTIIHGTCTYLMPDFMVIVCGCVVSQSKPRNTAKLLMKSEKQYSTAWISALRGLNLYHYAAPFLELHCYHTTSLHIGLSGL